jgi:hypothetical protein
MPVGPVGGNPGDERRPVIQPDLPGRCAARAPVNFDYFIASTSQKNRSVSLPENSHSEWADLQG